LGSDTGGSIRQPAAFCGVVGLKPTYGAVSRYGLIAMASSLDQIGPLAKTVEDVEILFSAIKGRDPLDSTTVGFDEVGIENFSPPKTIGVPRQSLSLSGKTPGLDVGVEQNIKNLIEVLKEEGFQIKEISLESLEYAMAVYYIIMPAEVSANLARYDGLKYGFKKEGRSLFKDYLKTRSEGFGEEVKRRILLGTYVLSAGYYDEYYGKAARVRSWIRNDFEKAFKGVDLILMPTTPAPAFKIGVKTINPVEMYLADIYTVAANLAGLPAISVPCGVTEHEGAILPTGVQFLAPWFRERSLFYAGKVVERFTELERFNNEARQESWQE
jgi:aspartyl-tRNA(Asn)/glutamyl-tRNA(Gln) amidotransferase subunit A